MDRERPIRTGEPRQRARRLKPEDRKTHLCAIAVEVIAEHGLGHSSHSLVAKRSGVSLPTVIHYYPLHGDLIDAALAAVAEFLITGIAQRAAAAVSDPAAAAEEMLILLARAIDDQEDMVRVWLDWSTATRHPAWPAYLAFRQRACDLVADLLSRGQTSGTIRPDRCAEETAEVVVAMAHMVAQMRFTGSHLPRVRRIVHDLFADYLLTPKAGQE